MVLAKAVGDEPNGAFGEWGVWRMGRLANGAFGEAGQSLTDEQLVQREPAADQAAKEPNA